MEYQYQRGVVGGTFDHLHLGHENLLKAALSQSKFLVIGIVEDVFATEKVFRDSLEPYPLRLAHLTDYLAKLGVKERVEVVPIHDLYGTTLTDRALAAIFVTAETAPNAEKINSGRAKLGLAPLAIEIVPYTLGDDNKIISSRRLREGHIDRAGHSYVKFFLQKSAYRLPDSLRARLQQPLGTIFPDLASAISTIPISAPVITVGDVTTLAFLASPHPPAVSVVDHRTRRHSLSLDSFPPVSFSLDNPASTISPSFADVFLAALAANRKTGKTQIISVTGEEDLLALPALLLAPLGSFVVYGQHGLGLVVTEVTESVKLIAKNLLTEFTQ